MPGTRRWFSMSLPNRTNRVYFGPLPHQEPLLGGWPMQAFFWLERDGTRTLVSPKPSRWGFSPSALRVVFAKRFVLNGLR
jgi:hypothetical protein